MFKLTLALSSLNTVSEYPPLWSPLEGTYRQWYVTIISYLRKI